MALHLGPIHVTALIFHGPHGCGDVVPCPPSLGLGDHTMVQVLVVVVPAEVVVVVERT